MCFGLHFGLILHHCSLQQGESPMAPRKLHKTAKCKHNISQILHHLVSALFLKVQGNRGGRKDYKTATQESIDYTNIVKKSTCFFF